VLGMVSGRRGFNPATNSAGVAQLVERQPSKLNVEGSSPFSRSEAELLRSFALLFAPGAETDTTRNAHLAQMVEHVLGKDEVTSSILVVGSSSRPLRSHIPAGRESEG
jgi:hypothetical protein